MQNLKPTKEIKIIFLKKINKPSHQVIHHCQQFKRLIIFKKNNLKIVHLSMIRE